MRKVPSVLFPFTYAAVAPRRRSGSSVRGLAPLKGPGPEKPAIFRPLSLAVGRTIPRKSREQTRDVPTLSPVPHGSA